MTKPLLIAALVLTVGFAAAALAYRAQAPASSDQAVTAAVVAPPAARDIFPKVLNH
jgi:hypothetical protein